MKKEMPWSMTWYEPDYLNINWEPEGDYHPHNLMPEPYIEIDQSEFMRRMFCGAYGLRGTNFRQVFLPDERAQYGVHFYFFPHYALAILKCEWNYVRISEESKRMVAQGKGTLIQHKRDIYRVRYFRVGCLHSNLYEVTHAMHDHEQICPDCGFRLRYDSSG